MDRKRRKLSSIASESDEKQVATKLHCLTKSLEEIHTLLTRVMSSCGTHTDFSDTLMLTGDMVEHISRMQFVSPYRCTCQSVTDSFASFQSLMRHVKQHSNRNHAQYVTQQCNHSLCYGSGYKIFRPRIRSHHKLVLLHNFVVVTPYDTSVRMSVVSFGSGRITVMSIT